MSAERKLMGTTDGGGDVTYIEDVFSTYLYTGTGSAQTITNGVDLSTKGGMVWLKGRSGATPHALFDTARGAGNILASNTTAAQLTNSAWPNTLTSFSSNGFSLGNDSYSYGTNISGATYTSWTLREQAKFFDVVTYTGNGSARTIAHNLGSAPGCIIVKCTSATQNWAVYHRSQASASYYTKLNLTDAETLDSTVWNATAPTSSVFSVGTSALTNSNGATYVAYLFAHDAGGFGASGTDSVISCGSFTTDASGNVGTVNLGWEPQWLLVKATTAAQSWFIFDVMRGWAVSGIGNAVTANSAGAELNYFGGTDYFHPTATGFAGSGNFFGANTPVIYIAIRRGPMRTPTSGTSVFSPITVNAAAGTKSTTGFPVDMQIMGIRPGAGNKGLTSDRLRGVSTTSTDGGTQLITSSIAAETTANAATLFWDNTGFQMPINYSSSSDIFWNFGRAPGFFDVVCYTGTGVAGTVNHNLGVVPEMMLVKSRNVNAYWRWYWAPLGATKNFYMPNNEAAVTQTEIWNNTAPTSTVFTVGTSTDTNFASRTYVAYLFASCPGVSKVGSYTGTGAAQTVDCGFTGGARFVLIKRTDSTGDWYTYDTARGMVSGTDPYLLMNSTAAENTSTNYVFTSSTGFSIQAAAPAGINANGGTFIYLAIA